VVLSDGLFVRWGHLLWYWLSCFLLAHWRPVRRNLTTSQKRIRESFSRGSGKVEKTKNLVGVGADVCTETPREFVMS
jgi:hypothetical protein